MAGTLGQMSNTPLPLTADFPPPSLEAWRAVVDKALKGADFDKKLTTTLYDGIRLQPLYTKADAPAEGNPMGFPGSAPFVRGAGAEGTLRGWDIRQLIAHPDPKQANAEVLEDLERGVSSVLIRFDAATRSGQPGAEALQGVDGVMIASAEDLDTVLAGVMLDIAPVALEAGASGTAAARLMLEVWKQRGCTGEAAQGALNVDPLGALAAQGTLPQGVESALGAMASLAAEVSATLPHVTTVGVSGVPYSNAGASEAQELACTLAAGVAYLRSLTAAGLSVEAACRQIAFTLTTGTDFFLAIAKLRAARLLWNRVGEASGASPEARAMRLHACTAPRVLSQRDPWVNLLRVTVTTFAAGVGGAESITAAPFTEALGLPTAFGRRIARNTQIILQEESNLARVIDPAGGSWFIESLTRQLAEQAWAEFQEIEKQGGLAAALTSGWLGARLTATWEARRGNIAQRKEALTGINEFPNLTEAPVEVVRPDLATLRKGAAARLKAVEPSRTLAALLAAEGTAATPPCAPLPAHRFAEDFEALRDAADAVKAKTGQWPRLALIPLGPVAQHTARATYARNFFEAGGIEAVPAPDLIATPEEAVAAFQASGASIACLCGADDLYAEQTEAVAAALKGAGATHLFLAGRPASDDLKAAWTAAGIASFIFVGCNALETLTKTHALLGVDAP